MGKISTQTTLWPPHPGSLELVHLLRRQMNQEACLGTLRRRAPPLRTAVVVNDMLRDATDRTCRCTCGATPEGTIAKISLSCVYFRRHLAADLAHEHEVGSVFELAFP